MVGSGEDGKVFSKSEKVPFNYYQNHKNPHPIKILFHFNCISQKRIWHPRREKERNPRRSSCRGLKEE
jgi:hypothetical protein